MRQLNITKLLLACALLTFGMAQSAELPPIQLALIEGLSGPFGNTGEAVYRNIQWAVERVHSYSSC